MVWIKCTKFLVTLYILGLTLFLIPLTSCDEVTLLSTEGATTDLKWDVENWNSPAVFAGWEDLSMLYGNQTVRGYQVCQINHDASRSEKPETWLLLPQIDINGISRVYIEMNFTMRECSDLEKTCRETFSVYFRTTDNADDGTKFHPSIFTKIDTVAAEVRFSSVLWNPVVNHEKVYIPFMHSTKNTFLHIAIVDAGACVALMGVRVYHKVCRETMTGFARFQETETGVNDTSLVPVVGTCIANSVYPDAVFPTKDQVYSVSSTKSSGPLYRCTSSGDWQVPTGSCECTAGYEPNNSGTECIACKIGMFKSSIGNHPCVPCPANSGTSRPGATACQCNSGYDAIDSRSDPSRSSSRECQMCSKLPSQPRLLAVSTGKSYGPGNLRIFWQKPIDYGGCSKVLYYILCHYYPRSNMTTMTARKDGSTDCSHLEYDPSCCAAGGLKVKVRNLRGHAMYNFTILAYTMATKRRISPTLSETLFGGSKRMDSNVTMKLRSWLSNPELKALLLKSSSFITYETSDTLPTVVRSPAVVMENQTSVVITWNEPEFPNGNILFYKVKYAPEGEQMGSNCTNENLLSKTCKQVVTNDTKATLMHLLPGSKYKIIVSVHNSAGSNNDSEPLFVTTRSFNSPPVPNADNESTLPYIIATVAIATLVVLICVILFVQWKCRSKVKKNGDCNGAVEIPTQFRPYNSRHDTLDQRTYVDPFCLDTMPNHRFLCEISPESINIGEVIGCGEFGEVYKGTLATIDIKTGQETTINVAVKRLKNQCKPEEQKSFFQEAMSLEKFRHPNVVHLEAVVTQTRPFIIVTELMTNGCLHGFLTKLKVKSEAQLNGKPAKFPLSHPTMVKMLRGVASGMEYLIGRGYVHRDLAARNVLVSSDLVCKVADFGLLRELDKKDSENGSNGSGTYTTSGGKIAIKWTAPEAINFRTYTQFSDVWSFGILMWEAASYGEKPYWNYSNNEVIQALNDGMRLPAPNKCPSVLHHLMLQCWQRDPQSRPTFTQIISKLSYMLNESTVLDVPASPASCGQQEMFFEDEDSCAGDALSSSDSTDNPVSSDNYHQENFLRTVTIDSHNLSPDFEDDDDASPNEDVTLTSFNQDDGGSEVSSCTSTICASEITVCASNGTALYVPLLRSESDSEDVHSSRSNTPTRNFYSLNR